MFLFYENKNKKKNKTKGFNAFLKSVLFGNNIAEKEFGLADFQLCSSPLGQAVLSCAHSSKTLKLCIYTINHICWRSYTVAISPPLGNFFSDLLTKRKKSWNFHPLYINFRSNSRSKNHQINPIFTPLMFFWRYKALAFQLNFLPHPIKRKYLAINFVLLMGYLFNWFES